MAFKTFAAILVGSGEISMKIYELPKKTEIRELDHVRYYIELGSDTYRKGYIEYELVHELCHVLKQFRLKMEEYKVSDYVAYGSSAIREAANSELIIDQIQLKTGLKISLIDNAQQRFLLLKSIAEGMDNFEKLISEGAAVVDMGAGSLQITVYNAGQLIYTQNLKLGSLRIREILADLEGESTNFVNVMDDYIGNYIDTFSRLFMHEHQIKHIILVGEEIMSILKVIGTSSNKAYLKRSKFEEVSRSILTDSVNDLSEKYSIPYEAATLLKPTTIVYNQILMTSGAEKLWYAGSDLCDGIAIDYIEDNENYHPAHDFEKDIVGYARTIAARYDTNEEHTLNVEKLALAIFDGLKKESGLKPRDRILLQMACILHDCGKYVNMLGSTEYSYQIVLGTEFVGLSVEETNVVANIIKYNAWPDVPKLKDVFGLTFEYYMSMLKLTAILRIANVMDRSHKQKIKKVNVSLKEKELIIRADTIYDITLEQSTVANKSNFFEEIYGVNPILRTKRR